jgi:hypothetical protein
MADKRFKVGDVGGTGVAAIWEGAGDTLPFTDPDGHADRVLFTTKWNYSRIIDRRVVNCTFPAAKGKAERAGTINLFAHGQPGVPRVRGNTVLSGHKISMGCHIPIQIYSTSGMVRLAILGATSTNVVVCWYCDLRGFNDSGYTVFGAVTLPITVEIFDELN